MAFCERHFAGALFVSVARQRLSGCNRVAPTLIDQGFEQGRMTHRLSFPALSCLRGSYTRRNKAVVVNPFVPPACLDLNQSRPLRLCLGLECGQR